MQISYILFDLDDTLYPSSSGLAHVFKERILSYVADYLAISIPEAEAIREEKRLKFGTTLEWLLAEKEFRNIEEYFEAIHPTDLENFLSPDPELIAMLERLPVKTSILTNSPSEHAERVSRFLKIRHFMEHIFDLRLNNLLGKPDLSAYNRALDTIGCKPQEVLFADDMPDYLYAFRDMGGHVVLVDENDRFAHTDLPRITTVHQIERFFY